MVREERVRHKNLYQHYSREFRTIRRAGQIEWVDDTVGLDTQYRQARLCLYNDFYNQSLWTSANKSGTGIWSLVTRSRERESGREEERDLLLLGCEITTFSMERRHWAGYKV